MFSIFKRDPLKSYGDDLNKLETLFSNLSLDFQHSDNIGIKHRHKYGDLNVTFLSMSRVPCKRHESLVLREKNVWVGTLTRTHLGDVPVFRVTLPGKASQKDEIHALITGLKQAMDADNRLRTLCVAA